MACIRSVDSLKVSIASAVRLGGFDLSVPAVVIVWSTWFRVAVTADYGS